MQRATDEEIAQVWKMFKPFNLLFRASDIFGLDFKAKTAVYLTGMVFNTLERSVDGSMVVFTAMVAAGTDPDKLIGYMKKGVPQSIDALKDPLSMILWAHISEELAELTKHNHLLPDTTAEDDAWRHQHTQKFWLQKALDFFEYWSIGKSRQTQENLEKLKEALALVQPNNFN